jgi:rhodanese-related sulfurtransferase
VNVSTINAEALHGRCRTGETVDLIDVRTPAEFREVRVGFARNVPLDRLDPAGVMKARANASGPLYVICRSGSRAEQACRKFAAAGYPDVVSVEGGTLAWERAGLPVARGRKAMSLERQVRIAAGSLVLLGVVLALLVHPWFVLLSGFIGAGLVFAGITDTCGMGLMLARMPWNRVEEPAPACSLATKV